MMIAGIIWQSFAGKAGTLSMVNMREMFPDEGVLREENQRKSNLMLP